MYNSSLKQEYINHCMEQTNNQSFHDYLIRNFNKFEHFEEEYGKDLSEFTTPEILSAYKFQMFGSIETLLTLNTQLKKYTAYCLYRNLVKDGQNHFNEMDKDILNDCISKYAFELSILSREQLEEEIENLYNPSEKFMALAYFEGLRGKDSCDLIEARVEQIKGNEFHLASGRTLEVSDLLIKYAIESANEYEYIPYRLSDRERNWQLTFKADDERVLKNLYNANSTEIKAQKRNLNTKLIRIKDYLGLEAISITSLRESGRIDLLKRLMEKGDYLSFRACYIENRDLIEYRYGVLSSLDRWLMKYKTFL